jgi:hypothetical protein
MDVVQGAYPGLYEIEGLSCPPKFWTTANDISFEEASHRMNEAEDLCALRNNFPLIASALLDAEREAGKLRKALEDCKEVLSSEYDECHVETLLRDVIEPALSLR